MIERDAKALKWDGKDRLVAFGDGLFLNVRKSSKTWVIRRRHGGKMEVTTLDKYPLMSVKAARVAAMEKALAQTAHGMTVEMLSEKYLAEVIDREHKRPELSRGYFDRAILPELGPRKVADIKTFDLAQLVQSYARRGARSADALRSQLKKLFCYAVELGLIRDNPAEAISRRVSGYTARSRERVLTDDEIGIVWRENHHHAALCRFLLLTGLRISEAQKGYRDSDRWHVPAAVSKNGREHWVYLTPTARAQLTEPFDTSPTAVQAWLRRWCDKHGIDPRYTPHDLRRTAATRMADAGVEPFIIERMLNHTMQGVMAVYNRAEYEAERIEAARTLEVALLRVVAPR
jgi:integrase